ncbi:unnamed protein product [Symbiodinium sp. KB8]|nr:unnamed protein product [Symbiodinium sp. KB8]
MNDAPAKMRRPSSRWTLAAILVLCLRGACNGFVAPGWRPAAQRGFKPASISLPAPGPAKRPPSAREALLMPISGAGEALATVLVSEVGDKTFFLTMILAMRSSRRLALLSSQSALWVMMFVSTSIGVMLRRLTLTVSSGSIIRWTAAALMILFGLQSFRETMGGDEDGEEDEGEKGDAQSEIDGVLHKARGHHHPHRFSLMYAFRFAVLIFLAEWGDRSMLATITLATTKSPLGVFIGGCFGHLIAGTLAVLSGHFLEEHVSDRLVKLVGGVLFIGFGLTTLAGVY